MNSSLKSQLESLRAELTSKGVVDVKFHINKEVNPSVDALAEDAIELIGAVLNGDTRPFVGFGDSQNPETVEWLNKISENSVGGTL